MNLLPGWIGVRFSLGARASPFLSFLTRVSLLGLALGVAALVTVVSVMNGFDTQLKQRILGAVPHLVVRVPEGEVPPLIPGVRSMAPFSQAEAMLLSGGESRLVMVYGIRPEVEADLSIIPLHIFTGSLDALQPGSFRAIAGAPLAARLGLWKNASMTLLIPTPSKGGNTVVPAVGRVQLEGTFSLGSELDYALVLMHLEDLRSITGQRTNTWRMTFEDIFAVSQVVKDPGLTVISSWVEAYGDFFDTVRMEKLMMFLLLTLIVMIAAFNTVSGLSMMVKEKQGEIAVLRTMGMSSRQVMLVFMAQGAMIGFLGVIVGLLLGLPLAFNVSTVVGFFEELMGARMLAGTYFDSVPSDVRWPDIIAIAGVSGVISILATLYPAWRASQIEPAGVLKAD